MFDKISQNEYTPENQIELFDEFNNRVLFSNRNFPGLIKYMGSKTKIIDYVINGISDVYLGETVVDLFAGSGTLSGALRGRVPIISNDIQHYSEILSGSYLANLKMNEKDLESLLFNINQEAEQHAKELQILIKDYNINYSNIHSLSEFKNAEELERKTINIDFPKNINYYLFTKNYSGTYWSSDQCTWIDGYRKIAQSYEGDDIFYIIMASLMFAMSYNSQSTGHYAQYRVAENEKSMQDIMIYRTKDISTYFNRKFLELVNFSKKIQNNKPKEFMSRDYEKCLETIPESSTIYADPPYAFVHYSRFYHALETLVRYDYPDIKYKGRYRTDRHQSPFSIKSQAPAAFAKMFSLVKEKNSNLALSYSNTGLISLDEITEIANAEFGIQYNIELRALDYKHSRMGRTGTKEKNVSEALLLASRK
ncbi:DNA adenine methylase [Enterococcus innesii]|uniref:DNA adenine methylase n=1 Tax=Enterococcus innesii TaxID=2839759 RepID=UPI003984B17A